MLLGAINKTSYASIADGQDIACQMELATYKREHTVQAAGLAKDVEVPAKGARTDATFPRCNKCVFLRA